MGGTSGPGGPPPPPGAAAVGQGMTLPFLVATYIQATASRRAGPMVAGVVLGEATGPRISSSRPLCGQSVR